MSQPISMEQEISVFDLREDEARYSEMSVQERAFLLRIFLEASPKNIIEIGVSSGASSLCLCRAAANISGARVTSIDISQKWYQNTEFETGFLAKEWEKRNYWGKDVSEVVNEFEANGEKFDFLFLDTVHTHPVESLNFLSIFPYLTENAVVVLHDISLFSGIRRGIYESYGNYSQLACRILFDTIVADKYELDEKSLLPSEHYANIGAFHLNKDTRKYIKNVFLSLKQPWMFYPSNLIDISKIIRKYYDLECQQIFENAATVNLSYLVNDCDNFDFRTFGDIFNFIRLNANELKNKLKKFNKIYFYGAGKLCRPLLDTFGILELPLPAAIFDRNAHKINDELQNALFGRFNCVGGKTIPVIPLDYSCLEENDAVIVTIQDYYVQNSVCANAYLGRCKNWITYSDIVRMSF